MGSLDPDEAASSLARQLRAKGGRGSGIPPAPAIAVDETVLDPLSFGLELTGGGVRGGAGGGGGPPEPEETYFIALETDDIILMEPGGGILREDAP